MENVAPVQSVMAVKPKQKSKRKLILSVIAFVVLLGALRFFYESMTYVSTDNAMVQAHTVMISAKVPGIVLRVTVEENQKVKTGDPMIQIDDRDFRNTLHQMEAELSSQQARVADAQKSRARISELFRGSAVSRQQLDTANATYDEQSRKFTALQAQVEQARLNLSYTEIRAPSNGTIARKSVETGMLAPVGQPLLGFVEASERWVVANFKETDLNSLAPGKKCSVSVDAIPDKEYEGEVESISPSTGATFTLLPPDNATGNFTKVVQRVPVRIKLLNLVEGDLDRLHVGLSADVKVRIR